MKVKPETRGSWAVIADRSALTALGSDRGVRRDRLQWLSFQGLSHAVERSERVAEWYIRCTAVAITSLKECVDVDPNLRSGIPVLKGTRFTVAQMFAEIAETSGPAELAENFDLDEGAIKLVLEGFALLLDKPVSE